MKTPALVVPLLVSAALSAQKPAEQSAEKPAPVTALDNPVTGLDPELMGVGLGLDKHFEALAKETYKTVVCVSAHFRNENIDDAEARQKRSSWIRDPINITDYPGFDKRGIGSGVVVSSLGEILTCRHFLLDEDGEMADIVSVETPDQRHTICDVIAMEPTLDIALLRMRVYSENDPPSFKVATFGDSASAKAGHLVFGVGDPDGPEQFFGVGPITTPPNRDCYQELLSSTYLQLAMRVHPQTYGGPLINMRGEVIGVLLPRIVKNGPTLDQPNLGIEFAMPSNILKGIYKALRQVKSFKSPWLGFAVMSRTELRREKGPEAFNALKKPRFGILLENVFDPSPAMKLGLKPGDWLVRFDGEPVYSPLDFQKLLYIAGIGAEVPIEIYREGETIELVIPIEERPANATFR